MPHYINFPPKYCQSHLQHNYSVTTLSLCVKNNKPVILLQYFMRSIDAFTSNSFVLV